MLYAFVDGSVTGGAWGSKKGPKTVPQNHIGWVVRTPEGAWVAHHYFFMGENETYTGNTAEHFAVSSVLRWLIRNGHTRHGVIVHSDSQVAVGQLSGAFAVHNELLAKYVKSSRELMEKFPFVKMRWIPREKNSEADAISKSGQAKYAKHFPAGLPATELPPELIEKWR